MRSSIFSEVGPSLNLLSGEVKQTLANGTIDVFLQEKCEVIKISKILLPRIDSFYQLKCGDLVLVWFNEINNEGIILGVIYSIEDSGSNNNISNTKESIPDELVIEAKKNLTLKCGDGSITLRKDGKILIKGKDLVSQAKRTNRIKGGSVAIN